MICPRAKLQFALSVVVVYWLVADVHLISPLQLMLAGMILLAAAGASALVRPLYGPRAICTAL